MAVASYNVTFLKKEKISSDGYKFYFKKPKSFEFTAGQYLKMKLDIKNPDSRGASRYFTISASPTEKDLFIVTKIGRSTFKQTLNDLKIGAKVQIRGPWGDFTLRQAQGKPSKTKVNYVFLAGGIGLTPFRSILKYTTDKQSLRSSASPAVLKKFSVSIFMINSYSDEKAAALAGVLEEFKSLPGFKLEVILERINTDLLQKKLDLHSSNIYYISGPEKMVSALASDLRKKGVKEENIKIDDFPGYTVRD